MRLQRLLEFFDLDEHWLVRQLRRKCAYEVECVARDFEILSSDVQNQFNDTELENAAELIKNADEKTQEAIKRSMRFSAQNSLSALIHLMDMQFTLEPNTGEFNQTNLLDDFLMQAESKPADK